MPSRPSVRAIAYAEFRHRPLARSCSFRRGITIAWLYHEHVAGNAIIVTVPAECPVHRRVNAHSTLPLTRDRATTRPTSPLRHIVTCLLHIYRLVCRRASRFEQPRTMLHTTNTSTSHISAYRYHTPATSSVVWRARRTEMPVVISRYHFTSRTFILS